MVYRINKKLTFKKVKNKTFLLYGSVDCSGHGLMTPQLLKEYFMVSRAVTGNKGG